MGKEIRKQLGHGHTVEGAFGTAKMTFGLDHVYTRLEETPRR